MSDEICIGGGCPDCGAQYGEHHSFCIFAKQKMSLMQIGDTREVTDLQDELEGQQGTFEVERSHEMFKIVVQNGRLTYPGLENAEHPRNTHERWKVKKILD